MSLFELCFDFDTHSCRTVLVLDCSLYVASTARRLLIIECSAAPSPQAASVTVRFRYKGKLSRGTSELVGHQPRGTSGSNGSGGTSERTTTNGDDSRK